MDTSEVWNMSLCCFAVHKSVGYFLANSSISVGYLLVSSKKVWVILAAKKVGYAKKVFNPHFWTNQICCM